MMVQSNLKLGISTPVMVEEDNLVEHVRFFSEFLSANEDVYQEKVEDMISKNGTRLIVNLNDIRNYNAEKSRE